MPARWSSRGTPRKSCCSRRTRVRHRSCRASTAPSASEKGSVPPHPEEHRAAMRLEGWETVVLLAMLRDGPRRGLLGMRSLLRSKRAMIPSKDKLTICFAHAAYRMKDRFELRQTGIRNFEVRAYD